MKSKNVQHSFVKCTPTKRNIVKQLIHIIKHCFCHVKLFLCDFNFRMIFSRDVSLTFFSLKNLMYKYCEFFKSFSDFFCILDITNQVLLCLMSSFHSIDLPSLSRTQSLTLSCGNSNEFFIIFR